MHSQILSSNTKKLEKGQNNSFPSINRNDLMLGILSEDVNENERLKLSNLYGEITYMEKMDLKYISEIFLSSQSDLEIYEILNNLKKDKNLSFVGD